jgi:hypothetical protein
VPVSAARRRRTVAVLAIVASVLGITSGLAGTAVAGSTPAAAGEFVPIRPARLLNSATGKGWSGKLAPGATKTLTARGVAGVPSTDVLAVMLHITTSGATSTRINRNGNLWAWPAGRTRPKFATVANARKGATADNTAIISLGSGGRISFYNGAHGTAVNVIADVEGYVTQNSTIVAGATFAPLPPKRVMDTRTGTGSRAAPLSAGKQRTFQPLGVGGVPTTNVAAVVLNLGAQAAGTNCWVQVQPTGSSPKNGTYPRVQAYTTYASQQLAVVRPDPDAGGLAFSTNCPSVDVFADIEGYYLANTDGSSGDVYVPSSAPMRVIDTRRNLGITGKMTPGRVVAGSSAVAVTGVDGVPVTADAVALSVGTVDGNATGANTIWADGTAQPTNVSTVNVDPVVPESNLAFIGTGANGKVDVAASSSNRHESNDLFADIEGYFYHSGSTDSNFGTPQYFPGTNGDTYYNTEGTSGDTIVSANDTRGNQHDCIAPKIYGSDVAIFDVKGDDPADLQVSTVNCMRSFGRLADPNQPDHCTWKSGGITRVGSSLYLAVARQIKACDTDQSNGLQPSSNASIMRSDDDGKTWVNPWSSTPSADGDAPPWNAGLNRYRAMFPGKTFPAPFFIQYGPGDTQAVDGGDQYVYAVSTDGYTYNGNYLRLARVPRNQIQNAKAWQYFHRTAANHRAWTSSSSDATHILTATHRLSQPAIQYVPALGEYVLTTFYFAQAHSTFPSSTVNPYVRWEMFTSPKPWGPWKRAYEHSSQRNLWCAASPCQLVSQPGAKSIDVGSPSDWTGYYDVSLVQKFVYSRPLDDQMLFANGDWMHTNRFPGEHLYSLHGLPFDLSALPPP